jgi:hypothetical protein
MELGENRNIDGFDRGNGAALINLSRRHANCCVLRGKGRVWIIAGIEGIEAGAELTYDYGSDSTRADKRSGFSQGAMPVGARYQRCGLAIIGQKKS